MNDFFKKISAVEIRNLLAIITTIGCFVLLYLLIIKPVPTENKDILQIAVGFVFGGALGGVMGFFFGASKTTLADSAEKTDTTNIPTK